MVSEDLENLKIKKEREPREIKEGIRKFEERRNIVIHSANMCGGIVIFIKEAYHQEITRLLSDTDTYQKLNKNPKLRYKKDLEKVVYKGLTRKI